jgi:transcription elongation GreA/GreB family factor
MSAPASPASPASPVPSKIALKRELASILAADLAAREHSHKVAREGATHDEAKPENDKDTRALEQSYLARGEARRVEELRAALVDVEALAAVVLGDGERVRLGALVRTEEDGEIASIWLAPHGGGSRLANGAVQVVTPGSPLGRALLGKRTADECEVVLAGRTRRLTIVSVS